MRRRATRNYNDDYQNDHEDGYEEEEDDKDLRGRLPEQRAVPVIPNN